MSTLHEDVQRDVERLLESRVFVVSSPPKLGLTRERCTNGVYMEIPLRWNATDDEYERQLGQTRIEITYAGHMALCAALGGECPECKRAMPEGEPHGGTKRFVCSGDGPGFHEACRFMTDDAEEAARHFEATSHAVDDREGN